MMKKSIYNIALAAIALMAASCNDIVTDTDNALDVAPNETECEPIVLDFDISLVGYEGQSRSYGNWKTSDRIYLTFYGPGISSTENETPIAYGYAMYNFNTQNWELQSYSGTFQAGTDMLLKAFYIENQESTYSYSYIYPRNTDGFYVGEGTYTYPGENTTIKAIAMLKPYFSRIRFRMEQPTSFKVAGFKVISSISISNGTVNSYFSDGTSITSFYSYSSPEADGYYYTDYIYFDPYTKSATSCDRISLLNEGTSKVYLLPNFSGSHNLKSGDPKSGYIDLPSIESHEGWLADDLKTIDAIANSYSSASQYNDNEYWTVPQEFNSKVGMYGYIYYYMVNYYTSQSDARMSITLAHGNYQVSYYTWTPAYGTGSGNKWTSNYFIYNPNSTTDRYTYNIRSLYTRAYIYSFVISNFPR